MTNLLRIMVLKGNRLAMDLYVHARVSENRLCVVGNTALSLETIGATSPGQAYSSDFTGGPAVLYDIGGVGTWACARCTR